MAHDAADNSPDAERHADRRHDVGGDRGAARRHVDDETGRRAAVGKNERGDSGSRGTTRL
jgi:hypothetical protein